MSERASARALVTFQVNGSMLAIRVEDVIEVAPLKPITPVPGTSPSLCGVTSWRGRTIPVLHLGLLLKEAEGAPEERSRMLVLARPEPFGVLVDEPGHVIRSESVARSPWIRADGALVRVLDPLDLLHEAGIPESP